MKTPKHLHESAYFMTRTIMDESIITGMSASDPSEPKLYTLSEIMEKFARECVKGINRDYPVRVRHACGEVVVSSDLV